MAGDEEASETRDTNTKIEAPNDYEDLFDDISSTDDLASDDEFAALIEQNEKSSK